MNDATGLDQRAIVTGGTGDSRGAFAPFDWALLTIIAVTWGASFLLIRVGVEHLHPVVVVTLRLAFGAATLSALRAARRRVPRSAWPSIALLGVVWMGGPFTLFALAERHIDSSLAGMLNATAPLFTALIAALAARRSPPARQRLGLLVGFAGVAMICLPSLHGGDRTLAGAGLVLFATLLYGIAFNLAAGLEQRYGALPVIWRAQLIALGLVAPFGLASAPGSSLAPSSVGAVAVLGCLGTALAFVAFTTMAGRVGSTRASVSVYFLPAVAIALGAVLADEHIAAIAVLGTALIAGGAYLTSHS